MRDYRREDGKASERYGEFYAAKDSSYVGYFKNGEFIVKSFNKEISNSQLHGNNF